MYSSFLSATFLLIVTLFCLSDSVQAQTSTAPFASSAPTKPAICSVVGEHMLGEKSADVSAIQTFLSMRGYGLAQSGEFDAATVSALKQFQKLYTADIITTQGLTAAPGIWDIYTAMKARDLVCSATGTLDTQVVTSNPSSTQNMIKTTAYSASVPIMNAVSVPALSSTQSGQSSGVSTIAAASTSADRASTTHPPSEPLVCIAFTVEPGTKNNNDVKNIQRWLISQGYNKVEATGNYGSFTQRAIKHFQEEYASDILALAGLTKATGTWGEYTAQKASALGLCAYDDPVDEATAVVSSVDAASHTVLEDIYPGVCVPRTIEPDVVGDKGNARDVKIIQRFLIKRGYTKVEATGYYGPTTKRAVEFFQKKYATDILEPAGLTKPTGTWGLRTAIKASELGLCNEK
jgi:peptidoglycan hydrolase-like protein with peptidoglycan-binding domain